MLLYYAAISQKTGNSFVFIFETGFKRGFTYGKHINDVLDCGRKVLSRGGVKVCLHLQIFEAVRNVRMTKRRSTYSKHSILMELEIAANVASVNDFNKTIVSMCVYISTSVLDL